MEKKIKVLVESKSASYSSETVMFGDKKFKIVAENGNAYSRLKVYMYTQNGDLCQVACSDDIPDYEYVYFISSENVRLLGNRKNIKAAEEYIKKAFND